jgi:biotin carboxylase
MTIGATNTRRVESGAKTLIVVYDYGSLSPSRLGEIAELLEINLVFVAPMSKHVEEMWPVLEYFGTIIDARRLRPERVAELAATYDPDGIVTFSEGQIAFTAELAACLNLRYHSPSSVSAMIRKDEQRRTLRAAGLDHVRFAVVSDGRDLDLALDGLQLPLIVKPIVGVASRNTCVVDTVRQCKTAVDTFLANAGTKSGREPTLILEEMLVGRRCEWRWGDYMAVDSLVTDEGVFPLFVTGKFDLARPFRERGCYIPPREPLAEVAHVQDLAAKTVRALSVSPGIADVEIKLTEDGPKVIELNGRLGGWVDDVAVRSGAPSPGVLAVKSALGFSINVASLHASTSIAFHYLIIPPVKARRVASVRDVEKLWSLPNVDRVSVLVSPGSDVAWTRGTNSSVASVTGVASSYDELRDTVDAIERVEWIAYT